MKWPWTKKKPEPKITIDAKTFYICVRCQEKYVLNVYPCPKCGGELIIEYTKQIKI